MKKTILFIAFLVGIHTQFISAQTSVLKDELFLSLYYSLQNALVLGNAESVAIKAEELKSLINSSSFKRTSESNKASLLENAGLIAATKNLKNQRDAFASLSADLLTVLKTDKLSDGPVYQLFCPMKNSYWLSPEKVVKNPYYGSSMLTCGKVVGVINTL